MLMRHKDIKCNERGWTYHYNIYKVHVPKYKGQNTDQVDELAAPTRILPLASYGGEYVVCKFVIYMCSYLSH